MRGSSKDQVRVTNYLRRLRGGSQPILARASDDQLYVVKFLANPQGRNLLFNEAAGNELFKSMRLPVPKWKQLLLTDEFLESNRNFMRENIALCGIAHEQGMCFGSRYMGGNDQDLLEILPRSSFKRVRNVEVFLQAWMLDVAAGHTDNRQALFLREASGHLKALFVDHGNMFRGASGSVTPHMLASAYLDKRIYPEISGTMRAKILRQANEMDSNSLWKKVLNLPEEWQSPEALANFANCLEQLADVRKMESILEKVLYFAGQARRQAMDQSYECMQTLALPRTGFDFSAAPFQAIA
ncbi:hypothetical protein ACOBR2_13750 [Telmatobacter bradus]|uniref:hypothetical protein n=1 Tax=Telmatobacter bradus TaxID=474953 RepID=UPI003B43467C